MKLKRSSGREWLRPAALADPKKRNGRLVVARRPSPSWTTQGRGIAAAVLLSPATGWLIRRSGGRGEALDCDPQARMAILPGSSMRALRVGSGRGPTLRTAPRGAESGWVKHATGSTCPGGVTTRINERLSPWLRRHSPPISHPGPPRGRHSDRGSGRVSRGAQEQR